MCGRPRVPALGRSGQGDQKRSDYKAFVNTHGPKTVDSDDTPPALRCSMYAAASPLGGGQRSIRDTLDLRAINQPG
jgi:hypothetical protein